MLSSMGNQTKWARNSAPMDRTIPVRSAEGLQHLVRGGLLLGVALGHDFA